MSSRIPMLHPSLKPSVKRKQEVCSCLRLRHAHTAKPLTSVSRTHHHHSAEGLHMGPDLNHTKLCQQCPLKLQFLLETCHLDPAEDEGLLFLQMLLKSSPPTKFVLIGQLSWQLLVLMLLDDPQRQLHYTRQH